MFASRHIPVLSLLALALSACADDGALQRFDLQSYVNAISGWAQRLLEDEADPDAEHFAMVPVDARGMLPDVRQGLRPIAVAVAGDRLCWAEENAGRIRCSALDGTGVHAVLRTHGPQGLAVDAKAKLLFWTSDGVYPRRVARASLDGGEVTTLFGGVDVHRPRAIAYDGASGNLVWSETVSGRVRVADIEGRRSRDIVTSGFGEVDRTDSRAQRILGLALLPEEDVLWADQARATIERSGMDGSDRQLLFDASAGVEAPAGIAYAAARRVLVWAEPAAAVLMLAALDAGSDRAPRRLLGAEAGLLEPRGIAVDPAGEWLYWSDAARDVIGRTDWQATRVEEMDLHEPGSGFVPRHVHRPAVEPCSAEAKRWAGQQLAVAMRVCLELVDAQQAVQVRLDDVAQSARPCRAILARRHARRDASARCLDAEDRRGVWNELTGWSARVPWWLEAVRPFIAARAEAAEDDATAALEFVDEAISAVRPPVPRGRRAFPASGQMVSYRATRRGTDLVAVADDGALRAGAPLRFRDNRDGTITDLATGLMWEKKCSGCGGLHDLARQFRWTSPHDETLWDWLDALNASGGAGFAGYSDWRIPNVKELQSIVDYERFNPAVSGAFHGPGCGLGCQDLSDPDCSCTENSEYWTSTTPASGSRLAFFVGFHLGLVGDLDKSDDLPARAVRGPLSSDEVGL